MSANVAESDLYGANIALWAEQQANALRRRAFNEIDWENVAEEIESVGINEVNATLSQLDNILRHRVYLLGWPDAQSVRRWTAELHDFQRQLRRHYRPSMTGSGKVTDEDVREAYRAALEYCIAHMETEPTQPLPAVCPWTLNELIEVR
jgi:hypothetical protein